MRSVFFNVFQSLIVVLYVQDNETNMMVKISVCIGLVIEIWKIQKVVTIKVRYIDPFWLVLLFLQAKWLNFLVIFRIFTIDCFK